MKKIFFLILILPLSLRVLSQGVDYKYDSKDILGIKQGTIYVIPTNDQPFDDSLNYYMQKFWKITPYKIIRREEADNLLKEETNYFLASVNMLGNDGYGTNSTVVSPIKENSKTIYIFHGSKKSKLKNIQYQDAIFCRLPFYGMENYSIGLGYIIKNLNDNVELLIDLQKSNKISGVNSPSKEWNPMLRSELCKRAKILKEKTLLIDEKAREVNVKEKAMKGYKFPYRIVTTSEMINLLNTDPKKYCFLAANADMDIYDAESKNLIYTAQTLTGSGSTQITEKHIQKLNDFIEKP